jgi:diguanylate cyclase (GGDEF)-like protein
VAQGKPFCLIMIDLNDFKDVNDRFGHLAGDHLLKQLAVELRAQFTPPDMVGRWGGDEFVAIAAGLLKDGEERAERIRKWALGEYKVSGGESLVKIGVGASIGVVQWDGAETGLDLLARADQRVYANKKDD